jgi:hypothetical protein
MKVLFLCAYDWANMAYKLSQSMIAAGEESRAVCLAVHPQATLPDKRAKLVKPEDIVSHLKWCDIVVVCHSEFFDLRGLNKPIYVFHGGSAYRNNAAEMNDFWNPQVEACFIQTQDLFGLGAKNEIELPAPIDITRHKPAYKRITRDRPLFGHYPSNHLKGSDKINYALFDAAHYSVIKYDYDSEKLGWEDHIKRLKKPDVIIESMGIGAGWGVNGAEAAALGKIVIARMTRLKEYEEEFGKCEIVVANNHDEMKKRILEINAMKPEDIRKKQISTRKWITKHSYRATGERLRRIFNGKR